MNKIWVIGIGYSPLDKKAKDIIYNSGIILASNRLLEIFKGYEDFEDVKDRIKVINNVHETINFIKSEIRPASGGSAEADNPQSAIITLLASGDPMFFGIGRMIVNEFGKDLVEIFPDLSSIQVAFSRIKEPWSDAFFMSLHGGPDPAKRRKLEYEIKDIPALLTQHNKIAILTDKVNNPSAIAKILQSARSESKLGRIDRRVASTIRPASGGQSAIKIYVCEKLGYVDEKITDGTPQDIAKMSFSDPNVVILITEDMKIRSYEDKRISTSHFIMPRFGLSENEIIHSRGLITKDEVRAVTIHKLKLPQKGVFWDIGAGSGSISIEAARLCPELKVFAIERDNEQIENIKENEKKFNVTNVEIIRGEAPDVLKDLPTPDRVLIGGSGGRLKDIVRFVDKKINSGIMIVNAVTIETLNEAMQCLGNAKFRTEVCEVSISRSKMINQKSHMSALNPIFIITGEKN